MGHRGHIGKTFLRVGVAALLLGAALTVRAATNVWIGSNGGSWTASGNWSGTYAAADTNEFTNTTLTVNLNTSASSAGILLTNTAGTITVTNTASTLTISTGYGINIAAGTLTLNVGTVSLGAAQTWTIASGGALDVGARVNNNGDLLTISGAGDATISGVVSGTGGLTMKSTGTLALSGANTYSGGTIISNGILVANTLDTAGGSSSIGTGSLTLNGGTLRYTGASGGTATFSTTLGANGGTLDYNSSAFSYVFYTGTLSGSGTLNIMDSSGNGNQWLFTNASPSFSGPINIGNGSANSGWLQVRGVTAANQVGTGTVTINGGGTFSYDQSAPATIANPIVLNGGALGVQSQPVTYSGPIAISNDSFIGGVQSTIGTNMTLSGVISGPGGFTTAGNNGTSTIILGNANTFSGGVTIDSGTVELNNTLAVQNSTINDATNNALAFGAPTSYNVGAISGSGNFGLTNAAGGIALSVGTNGASTTYSGVISGSGSLTKIGSGDLTLSGATANTYSGLTTVSGGELDLDKTAGVNAFGGNLTIAGGEVEWLANNQIGNTAVINVNSGSLNLNGASEAVANTTIGSAGLFTNGTSGAMFGGGVSNNGTIYLSASTFFTGIVTNTGTMFFQGAISNNLVNSGNGSITLNNTATITQTATINGGTLNLNGQLMTNGLLLVNGTGVVTNGIAGATVNGGVSNAATISVTANTFFNGPVTNTGAMFFQGAISNNLVSSAGAVTLNGNATITQNATVSGGIFNLNGKTYSNNLMVLTGTGVLTNGSGTAATFNGGLSNAATFAASQVFFNGIVTNTGAFFFQNDVISNNFVNSGSGTVTLNNSATITKVFMIDGGTVNLNGQTLTNGLLVVDGNGGVLTNAVSGATVNGGVTNASTIAVTANTYFNGPVTNTGKMFFQGAISNGLVNSGSFNLNDNATLTVAPANSGTINIATSTLTVNPAWANSGTVQLGGGVLTGGNLTNNSGATVAGFGTVSNQLVNAGVVTATNGNLNLIGAATGSGVYRAVAGTSASTLTFVNGGSVGSLFNTGATIQVEGTLTNTSLFVNEGTLMVAGGVYQSAANLTNASGAMIANSGVGSINAAAVFNLGTILATNATFTISNLVAQGGTVTIGAGGTLNLPGASSLTNFGMIDLQGGAGNNAVLNLGGASLTNKSGGTITGGGIVQNAAQVVNLSGGSIVATSTVVELQFTNGNTFGNAGTIVATGGATLTFGTAGVGSAIITNYGTINLARGTLRSGNITNLATGFFGGTGVVSALVVNQGRMNFSGTISNGLQDSGSFTLNDDTTITSNIVVNSGGVLDLVGNNLTNGVVLTISSGGVLTNGGAANAGATVIGGVTNGGTVYFTANTYIDGTVTNTGAFVFQGAISNNFVNTGNGTVTLNNTATITQTATINGGTLNLNGQTMANGQMLVSGTGVVTNGIAGATVSGGVSNANVIAVTASTYFDGPVTNTGAMFFQGAISNSLVNSGSFNLNGGNATITGLAANSGTVNVDGQTLTVVPAWANSGTILMAGGTVAGGTLTNVNGAVINGAGSISSLLVNNGLLVVTNGTMTITIAPQQNGVINVTDGGAPGTLSVTPAWNNNGTVSVASGGTVNGGNFTNAASGTVTNLGAINTLLVNQGRVVLGGSASNFQQTSGTNTISGAGTVTGTATVSGGLFDLNGGTYSNGLMVLSGAGVLTSSQANATFNGGLSNAATASFAQNVYFNGTITNMGAFLWQGAISNNFVNAGNGTVTLNNTATITKTATLNGGTFNLNGQTYSNGLMILGGSAVLTNGIAGATFNGGLSNDATVAVTANTFFNGAITNTGTFFLQGAVSNSFINTETATLTINNNSTITGLLANFAGNQVNIANGTLQLLTAPTQNGTLTIAATGALDIPTAWNNGGTIVLNGGAINSGNLTNLSGAAITGFATLSNAVINSAGALITANGGTLTLVGSLTQNGGVAVNGGSVLNVSQAWSSSGTINIAAGGAITGGNLTNTSATGTLSGSGFIDSFLVNEGRMNWGGTISNNFLQTAGSFTLSGGATITGTATINGGTLDLTGNSLTDGLLVIGPGGTLTNDVRGAALNGGITNAGTVNLVLDTYVNGPVTNTGTWIQRGAISNSVDNSGVMVLYTNSINMRVTGSIVNSGSLTFDTNGLVYVSGVVTNSGSFSFSGVISNNLVNSGSGSITLSDTATVTGNTLIDGGTLNLNGQSFTDALMVVDGTDGVLTNAVAGASLAGGLSNASVVAVTANTFFKGPVTNTGTFQWQGAISNTFVNSGTTKLNGAGTITGTSSITGGSFDLNGKSLASSQMIVTSAGVLTNSTAGASMSGAVTLQNSMLAGQLVTNAATLSGSGTISAPLVNSAAGVLTANSGLLTVTGALTQNGTINVAAASTLDVQQAFNNSGSLNMQGGFLTGGNIDNTAGNNISGFGTISNSIANAGLITATGGTLTLAGGAPTTAAGSGINVASGGTLSVTPDWANSGTLTVSGTLIGGTVTNTSNTGTLSGTGTIDAFVVNQGRVNWGGTMNNYLQTAGSLTLSGNATMTGNATISGGGFDLENNLLTVGLLTVNNGATMQNSDGVGTITGSVVNNGTVNFNVNDTFYDTHVVINGQVVNNGTWTEAGVINGTLVNTGSFDWTSQTYFFGFDTETSPILNGGITNTGLLTFDPSYAAQVNGSVTNSGAINFNGTATGNLWQTGGTFTLNGAGTISGPAGVAGGSFNLNGETYNGSTMVVSGTGALTNAVANATFNSGLSNAANVGVTANTFFKGAVTNTGTFAFMGAVSNTFVNSGDVVLNGSATISGALANSGSVNVNNGTLSLVVAPTQTGTITVNNGATLNAAQAWVNNGTISMLGGVVTNAAITNANFVSGYGTIDGGGVVNNGEIFANAGSISGNGTLTVRLASFTNNSSATIGTASSNAVLNILQTGNILINQGTVSLSGGTIDFNGGAGTITNFNIIAGVGNVASFPIVNAGTLASFVAQAPIAGLSNLIATVGVTNNGLLGANNLINGAATLSLTVSGGGSAIVNQGTVALQGGFLTVNGGAGVVTNNGMVYGVGTQILTVANQTSGKILASNGIFALGLQSNANAGVLSNLNAVSTIQLTNAFLKNTGTIVLNGGGLLMSGVITNESSIAGPGVISSSLYNDTPGVLLATNGVLNVATNAGALVQNLGLFTITSNATLNVVSSWVNTNGTVNILGGALTGGAVTNVGSVSGFGTISSQLVNLGGGTLTASGAGTLTLVAAPTQNGVVNIANAGTLNVEQAWLNSGTVNVQGGSLVGSTVTNSGTIFGSGTITPQVHNNSGGTVTANGGILTLTVAPSQSGSVIISNAATLNVLQAWQNGGTVNLQGGTAIGSTITNASNVSGFGTITPQLVNNVGATVTANGGTLTLTVAPAQLGNLVISNAATLNVLQAWQNSGTFNLFGGTAIGSGIANSSIVSGFGTITPQLANNSGATLTATGGALTLGGLSAQNGTVIATNGGTLNVLTAWQNSGTIVMLGGVVTNAAITNANFVSGYGTIDGGGVVNNGRIFANAGSISGNGTLTVRLTSFTNNSSATIGTASSNAVLNILQSGNILVNQGTVSLSGGTIDFNGGSGTITNFNIIAGVGNLASFPIVNAGTLASFVAQAPISGLSNLIATIGVTNNGLLGANNLINGAATLSLTVSGGGSAIVNQGTVAMQGGFITINGGAGVITNVNNGLVYGIGTQNLSVANLTTGKILASNGVFDLGLQSNANAGVLSNLNTASTILLTDAFLKNTGTIVLNGGGFLMNGVITNESSITGPGAIVSSLYNDTPGVVLATNGLLNVATNAGESVQNLGLFTITSDGTLNVVSSWVNTNGTVNILGGGLTGGAVTNVGLVSGFGTISSQLVNMGSGTLTASGAGSLTLVAAPTQNGWVNIANAGTLNVDQAWLNGGFVDLQGGSLVGSTVTNSGTIFGSGTIATQVRNNSGGTVTANGGTLTLSVAPNQLGSLVISNAATLNVLQAWQNSGTLNLQGGTAIGSTIGNASTITGFGTITPQVQNASGGTVTATGGTLTLAVAPSQLGTFAVVNGGTLNVQQAWQNGGVLSMAGGTAIGSTITNTSNVSGFGTITPQLVNNIGATVTANGGTLTLTVAPAQLGSLVISNAATLNALQAWQNSGSMKMRGGTVIGSGITNAGSLEGNGTINPQVVNNAGATLTADSGLLTLALALMQNGTVVVTNGGTLNVLTAWQNSGTATMLGGNITGSTVTNAGTMTGFGGVQNLVNNDLIYVTNGTLQASASFTQNGTVNVASNTRLDATPTWLNNGTILLNGGFTSGGAMTNTTSGFVVGFGTISNMVVNAGSLEATNGTLNLVNALTQSGTITVADAATLNSVLSWQNGGFLSMLGGNVTGGQLTNAGSVTGFGTFSPSVINNSGATITASGGGTLTLTAIPFQNGVVNILGTLNVASAWSNGSAGTVTINGGVLTGGTFTVDGTVGGNGTIAANMIVGSGKAVTVNGGTLNVTALTTMNGGAINSGALVNYGTISGNGTIGSTLSNPGYVRATNGLLYVQALSGNQATGTLEASAGGTLDANGVTPWLNNGQVILSGGTVIGGDISNNTSHSISGFGTITPNVYNSGQVVATNAGQTLSLNSSLVNLSSGTVTVNSGNLVVGGAFVNQGTLAMANSMGTFAGTVVNSGAWITDPTTNIFQNTYTLTRSGYIQAGGNDVYVFTNNGSQVASFVNQSAQSNTFNTVSAKFVFDATLSLTQTMYAAGSNIGNLSVSGGFNPVLVGIAATNALFQYEDNFALGTLEIGSTTEVAAADVNGGVDPSTSESALFVDELDLDPGAQLIISNDVQIYFISSNAFSSSQVTLLGDAGLHLLTSDASLVVPEPTVVLLWLSSIATLYAARKRGAGKK